MGGKDEAGAGAVEVRAAGDRDAGARARMDAGARARTVEPPPLSLRRTDSLAAEVRALAESIDELRATMSSFGEVTSERKGLGGQLELVVKRVLRKLVARHLDQEKEVHVALQAVLARLTGLLAAQHELFDENASALADESVRRDRSDER